MKKGFTLVEVLVASSILGMVLLSAVSVLSFISSTLYDGQTEYRNRNSLTDNIYYITREIQSAEGLRVSADGKTLKIKQRGISGYTFEYTFTDGLPTGSFNFKSKKMMDIDYEQSKFEITGGKIKIILAIYKNNLGFKAKPQTVEFEVAPRSGETDLGEEG
jgi:prepilin-type N-terminal cleavage/methylation domain-containing protein